MEQWTTGAAMEATGTRPIAFPFEPEIIGRAPRVVVGKWSDAGAVVKKLADVGLQASADQVARILDACQREGVVRHRPLRDEEFVTLAVAGGARPL
jgi:isopropylmalate/homocitrate/citramalate synthase